MKPAIRVENLSKQYRLGMRGKDQYNTLRESLASAFTAPFRRRSAAPNHSESKDNAFLALKDVSFAVQPGEVVGIIGRNGAGKSTLLKILSRVVEPSSGRAEILGRMGSLLEVGTGFHPELTGRENIYLNGAILGMRRSDIDRKFDEIVAFSEIERYLDTPVKRYSSGMYVRLAFAVAAHLDPEILVIDEVLAVGDQEFQRKCLGKISEISKSARTILFVSHNMSAIQNLCQQVAVLERGQLSYFGPCSKGIEHYVRSCDTSNGAEVDLSQHSRRSAGCVPVFRSMRMLDGSGVTTNHVSCGEPMTIELQTDWSGPPAKVHFWITVSDAAGCRLFTVGTFLAKAGPVNMPGDLVVCRLESVNLAPGRFSLDLFAKPLYATAPTDHIDGAAHFDVLPVDYYGNGRSPERTLGPYLVRSEWDVPN